MYKLRDLPDGVECYYCILCRRGMHDDDDVKTQTVYEGNTPVEILVHADCSSVADRTRLSRPEPEFIETTRGTRQMIMAKKTGGKGTKTTAKSKTKKQAVEEEDEDVVEEESEDEVDETEDEAEDAEDEDEDSEDDEDADEDEDEADDEDEDEEEAPKSKSKSKAKATSKKAAASDKKGKKGAKRGGGEKGAFAKNTGAEVLALLPDTTPKKVRAVAEALSKGKEVTHDQLVLLKEGVKKAAKTLRDNKKGSSASKLSALNQRVRRLERESRP